MDPVSQFKFACPNCSQHLQARPEEAGRTTECPSCFKKLIVPQAPANGGGKLILSAALAEPRRAPSAVAVSPEPITVGGGFPRGWRIFLVIAVVVAGLAVAGWALFQRGGEAARPPDSAQDGLWTDEFDQLQLLESPVAGRLNGWPFRATRTVWRKTTLTLRQAGGDPAMLSLEIRFPLKGGELVPGKTYQLRREGPPLSSPIQIVWKDDHGQRQARAFPSGYLLWVRFDSVTAERVSGRLHLCLPDPTHSWVAGSFAAAVETPVKKPQ